MSSEPPNQQPPESGGTGDALFQNPWHVITDCNLVARWPIPDELRQGVVAKLLEIIFGKKGKDGKKVTLIFLPIKKTLIRSPAFLFLRHFSVRWKNYSERPAQLT